MFSKMKIIMGKQRTTIDEGLALTVDFIKQNLHIYKTDIYNV